MDFLEIGPVGAQSNKFLLKLEPRDQIRAFYEIGAMMAWRMNFLKIGGHRDPKELIFLN